jgi:hypothetical protein
MQDQVSNLRRLTRDYRTYDNELRNLNSQVYDLREARKGCELLIIDILKEDAFKDYNKLKIEDDGSIIKIQRPQTWSKPWSLSQKELKSLLESYFDSTKNSNSTDCYNYILQEKKATLVADEFAISRTVAIEE